MKDSVIDLRKEEKKRARKKIPVACAQISYPGQYRLSHRDFLGAILALGLERETLGDILVEEGRQPRLDHAGPGNG